MPKTEIRAAAAPRLDEILSADALTFLGELHRRFNPTRLELLAARAQRQKRFDAGATPDFLAETKSIREGDWKVGAIPTDLQDRRVEITGPVDRKMIVNALNSGAKVFMADFEDATSPVFANMIDGQANLKDLWAGAIDFTDERTGKRYAVKETRRLRDRCSISVSTCFIARRSRPPPAPRRRFICRRWRAIWRRGFGMKCSRSRRSSSASPPARSRRRC
jgi:malate synthase